MTSPAERYAASRARAARAKSELAKFRATLPFELDPFQEDACEALEEGRGVLVAAPTGSGKTVVGLFGVHLALARGRRAMYTTPIKALSNQKYLELKAIHGEGGVGLLTGDISINPGAPVIVMTTEVLRNMIYNRSSALEGLDVVVMDEVHYLADRFRGPVWEEVIIHLPERVQVISLSATVSNAEEFGDWLTEVRGPTEVVVWEHRPVPLWQHVMVGKTIYDLYTPTRTDELRINPELAAAARRSSAPRSGRPPSRRVNRAAVVRALDGGALLPAIVFIFSRAGCEAAVEQVLHSGIDLTTEQEAKRIRTVVEHRVAGIPGEDLGALGFLRWCFALERGVAAHHAGLIPLFKEIVEELFTAGLLKVVYATETLALGINMPARSVVLEKLTKWDGAQHARLTPGEYTQLTGRAGRRGIDVEGHAVVLHSPEVDVESVAGLASKRTYPLRSAFRATYNMSVNLLARMSHEQAREVLQTSFAQFQADRGVVGLARDVRRAEAALEDTTGGLVCDRGDLREYARLRTLIKDAEREFSAAKSRAVRSGVEETLDEVRPGNIILFSRGRRRQHAVVHALTESPRVGVIIDVVTDDARSRRLGVEDLMGGVSIVGELRIGSRTNPRTPRGRQDLAARVRSFAAGESRTKPRRAHGPADDGKNRARLESLRAELRAHPVHSCPDLEEHMHGVRDHNRAQAERDRLIERIEGRTGTIAAGFDRIRALLLELGYLGEGDSVTARGELLRRIYSERDLVLAEVLNRGIWDHLDPSELAAAVTLVVYESRMDGVRHGSGGTTPALRRAVSRTLGLWGRLNEREREHGIAPTPEVDEGLVGAMYGWASGERLVAVLAEEELLPGDFVRWARQVIDVLDQISSIPTADAAVRENARQARVLVDRGIVALSSV
ncbi:MAG TPA: DEAD/DEAH box helicase [Actinomycetaceae bacterium]|nr:DEAD/DEAH box helicase [Actinomycetaceae bacterium]